MKNIPNWILTALKNNKFNCHNCNKILTRKNLKSLGIKESVGDSLSESLFIELVCVSCNGMTLFEIREMDLLEFAIMILDGVESERDVVEKDGEVIDDLSQTSLSDAFFAEAEQQRPKRKPPKRKKKSKITLKEIKESVKKIQDVKNHDEFLELLGMSKDDINKYKKPNKKEKKKPNDQQSK